MKLMPVFCAALLFSLLSSAAEDKNSSSSNLIETFRCEKFSGEGLGELKLKLIEKCNLDKPFSSSMAKMMGGEEYYMYCCHLKK